jgi:hypothetical protein
MTGVLVVTSVTAQTKVLPRIGAKPLVVTGHDARHDRDAQLHPHHPGQRYASDVLPGLLIIGVGMGCIFAPAIGTATLGVDVHETGVASAMVNTSQQIGGSVGLALLSTLSASAAAQLRAKPWPPAWAGRGGRDPRLHDGVHLGGRNLRPRPAPRAPHPAAKDPRACSLKTALARGLHAHHVEPRKLHQRRSRYFGGGSSR